MIKKWKSGKVSGVALVAQIAEANLAAKNLELDRVVRLNSELASERDFLRKVVLNLSSSHPR